ncbi:MAG: hypothetical protein WC761_01365 [Candidatus Paceibacterota bacterium]|jgi:hypothetical protein
MVIKTRKTRLEVEEIFGYTIDSGRPLYSPISVHGHLNYMIMSIKCTNIMQVYIPAGDGQLIETGKTKEFWELSLLAEDERVVYRTGASKEGLEAWVKSNFSPITEHRF